MQAHRWSLMLMALAAATSCSNDAACPTGSVRQNGACVEGDDAGDVRAPDGKGGLEAGTEGRPDAALSTGDGAASSTPGDAGPTDAGPACFADLDGDGHADPTNPVDCIDGLTPPIADDCDDTAERVNPEAVESCDDVDNDCDGKVDEELPRATYFADGDHDGHGAGPAVSACAAPAGHVSSSDDCNDADNSIFAGAPEACDSKDNNCAGGVDETSVDSTYYLDEDGDGHGKPGTAVVDCKAPSARHVLVGDDCDDGCDTCAPGNRETSCDGKDNDCNGATDEGLLNACGVCGTVPADICDGLDNNCNGTKDDGRACYKDEPGLACTTSCGTAGTGACSATCGLPSSADCTPPAEACNGQDDDCDNAVDENVFAKLSAAGETVYTQAATGTLDTAQVALLPRPAGGAWLMYRGFDRNAPETGRTIRFRQLDSGGTASAVVDSQSVTDGATFFAAETDGEWVVVLSRKRPTAGQAQNDSTWLRLQLFRASDLSFVSETVVVPREDYDDSDFGEKNDANDCHDVRPLAVGVLEDSAGNVQVATAYVMHTGVAGVPVGTTCTSTAATRFQVATYSVGGQWSLKSSVGLASTALGAAQVKLSSVPCRKSWVVSDAQGNAGLSNREFPANGANSAVEFEPVPGVTALGSLSRGDANCALTTEPLLITYTIGSTSYLRHWQVNTATGAVNRQGTDLTLPGGPWLGTSAVQSDGRWFLSSVEQATGMPHLWELTLANAPGSQLREVSLYTGVSLADPGNLAAGTALSEYPGFSGIVAAGTAVVAAFPSAFTGNLDSFRAAGDNTNRAAAVTYRIGCN